MLACSSEKRFRHWSLISNLQSSGVLKSTLKINNNKGNTDARRASFIQWSGSVNLPLNLSRHHGLGESIKPWSLGLIRGFLHLTLGFISHIFVFEYLLPHCRRVWDIFLLNLCLIFIQHCSLPSPSAYNYHLSTLISFQAAYIVPLTFMILAPYILIS